MVEKSEASYVPYDIVAVRFDGDDGWQLAATDRPIAEFGEELKRRHRIDLEMRRVTGGLVRVIRGAAFDPTSVGFDLVAGWGWAWDARARTWRAPEENILPPAGDPVFVDGIRIEFAPPETGSLRFRLEAGGQSATVDARHYLDPFPRLLEWLEAISEGRSVRAWANIAGSYVDFLAYDGVRAGCVRIAIAYSGGDPPDGFYRKIALDFEIERRCFVERFYRGMRTYADSSRYVPEEWAFIDLRQSLESRGLRFDVKLVARERTTTINRFFLKYFPQITVYFPNETDKGKEVGRFFDLVIKGGDPPPDMIEVPGSKFKVPAEFDAWDAAKREEYLRALLLEPAGSWSASDLRNLRSEKLEARLAK